MAHLLEALNAHSRSTRLAIIEALLHATVSQPERSVIAAPALSVQCEVRDDPVQQGQMSRLALHRWTGLAQLIAFLSLAAVVALPALDPHKQIGQYGHDSWTAERGLPGESVYQILQSKNGYLWLRTGSGLVRFDGVRFVSMDAEIGIGPVKAICMSADGDLLLQSMSRTMVYKNEQFSDYLPPASLTGGIVRAIFESREHEFFVGEDDFIYRIEKNGKPTKLRQGTGWISVFFEDHTGKIWIAGAFGLFSYSGGKLSEPIDTAAHGFKITSLTEDHLHRLWAGTTKGLYRIDGDGSTLTPVRQAGMPNLVTAVEEDRQGNVWLGTERSELVRLADRRIAAIDDVRGLTDETVLSLLEDREGSLWIGTASGLDRLRDTDLTTFTRREGLPSDRVNSAIALRDGSVDVFTNNGGLARIKNDVVTAYAENAKLPSLSGSALFESRDGSIWIGTTKGLSKIKDEKLTVYSDDSHFASNYISAISEDDESLIFTSTEASPFRFKDGKVLPFTIRGKATAFTATPIYTLTIYRDPSGILWFGTVIGLFKQPPAEPLEGSWQGKLNFGISSIFDDHRSSLWLGGYLPGFVQFRVRDGRVTHYTRKDGLFDGFTSRILADDEGNLWMSTDEGIYSASQKALEDFADGKATFIPSRRYGLPDGMRTTAASGTGSQPGGCKTPDGRLWFTTMKGIVAVDPRHLTHNNLVPPVIVESVVADGVTQSRGGPIEILPGMKAIEIYYTALSLKIPERVRFKYQLEGYDHDWVDPGTRRVAYYTNLPPGKYSFRVIAANDEGVWNDQGASVDIVLRPHFYQTTLFYIACILFVIAVAMAANRRYTRLIRARAEHLSKLVEERTAELKESHRKLEQLAHFDALTELPNRRKFREDFRIMFDQTREQESRFSLLLIDFDRFKKINDTFGHDAGDAFLVEASKRLTSAIRASDRIARLGGDEFAILLRGDSDDIDVKWVCDRIVHHFTAAVDFRGLKILATVSIGVAVFPKHGNTEDELFKSADLALYQAKRLGRNKWYLYTEELQIASPS